MLKDKSLQNLIVHILVKSEKKETSVIYYLSYGLKLFSYSYWEI